MPGRPLRKCKLCHKPRPLLTYPNGLCYSCGAPVIPHPQNWTPEQDAKLKQTWLAHQALGYPSMRARITKVAELVNKTVGAVRYRLERLGLYPRGKKMGRPPKSP